MDKIKENISKKELLERAKNELNKRNKSITDNKVIRK